MCFHIQELWLKSEGHMGGQYLANPRRKEKNMPVEDIFSQRQKRLRGEVPDVYQYENIPEALRVQIVCIMNDAFEIIKYDSRANKVYEEVYKTFCREHGRRQVDRSSHPYSKLIVKNDSYSESIEEIIYTEETNYVLDVIELFFQHINQPNPYDKQSPLKGLDVPPSNKVGRQNYQQMLMYSIEKHLQYKNTVNELNQQFQEHGVGYQFESGKIVRIDSPFIHSQVVQPALGMLSNPMYEGANAEFLNAHEHYRAGRYKDCVNECLKAFESCIKSICNMRRWAYQEGDTINQLINIIFKNRLIPDFLQSHFSALRCTLESGLPPVRNRRSGHGQGPRIVKVPDYIAAYSLNLTASNILFLAHANENLT